MLCYTRRSYGASESAEILLVTNGFNPSAYSLFLPFMLQDDFLETDFAVGAMFMRITQGPYSRSIVKDIDPLEIGTFFGNIGGFWGK